MLSALESERAVLAAVIYDPNTLPIVGHRLKPHHFSDRGNAAIYQAAMDLADDGKPVDLTTLAEVLRKREQLTLVPVSYIGELQGCLATASQLYLDTYTDEIIEAYTRREVMSAAQAAWVAGSRPDTPSGKIIADLTARLLELTTGQHRKSAVTIGEALIDAFTHMEKAAREGGIQGIATGFTDLDDLIGGLRGGQLVLLASRPGVGKSSFATCVAAHTALAERKSVALFSLEMNAREVAYRLLSQESRVAGHKITRGQIHDGDRALLVDAATLLGPSKIMIDESTALTPTELRAKTAAIKARSGLDLIIVDYIGLMRCDRQRESQNVEIGEISKALLGLAKDMDVPVLALSQLSRNSEREDRRPELHDLRDSGSLEQDAHIVMFLYRTKDESDKTEVLVKKNRAGRTGTVYLGWNPSITRFENYKEF